MLLARPAVVFFKHMDEKLKNAASFIKTLTAENQSLNSQLKSTQEELQKTTEVLTRIKDKTRELLLQHKQDIAAKDQEIEGLKHKLQTASSPQQNQAQEPSSTVNATTATSPIYQAPPVPTIDIKPLQDEINKLQLDLVQKTNDYNIILNDLTIKENEYNDTYNALIDKHEQELKSLSIESNQKQSNIQELQQLLKQMEVKSALRITHLQQENKELLLKIQNNTDVNTQLKGEIDLLKQDLLKINAYKQTIHLLETQLQEVTLGTNLKNNINDLEMNKQLTFTINNLKLENEQLQQQLERNKHVENGLQQKLQQSLKQQEELKQQMAVLQETVATLKQQELLINPKELERLKNKIHKYELEATNLIDKQLASDMILKYIKSDKKQDIILIMKEIFHWSDAELPLNITAEWVKWLNQEEME